MFGSVGIAPPVEPGVHGRLGRRIADSERVILDPIRGEDDRRVVRHLNATTTQKVSQTKDIILTVV